MPDSSPVLALPYLQAAQAQKHVTHNEALQRLDLLVQMRVLRFDATTPPDLPQEGDIHALGAAPTGIWAGRGGRLAVWLDDGWSYLDPRPGWRAFGIAEGELRLFDGSGWIPVGGDAHPETLGVNTGADAVNRLAVRAGAVLLTHEGAGHQLKINKAGAGDTASLLFQSDWNGHAEMGLAGNNDFSVKVSPDGSAWVTALAIDAASGNFSGAMDAPSDGETYGRRDGAWQAALGRGDILGTVSQSGGLPSGAVIEHGSNASGDYVRFADGTQICTALVSVDLSLFGQNQQFSYPAAFAARPCGSGVLEPSGQAGVDAWLNTEPVVSCHGSYWWVRLRSGEARSVNVQTWAIGRWF